MENLNFVIFALGCDQAPDDCSYVPERTEYCASRQDCESILPLTFHEAETPPVALGDSILASRKRVENNIAFEWTIGADGRLKVAVVGPHDEIFGDVLSTVVASGKGWRAPAG